MLRRMRRSSVIPALLAGALALTGAACRKRETPVERGDRDQILHLAAGGEPRDLDPTMGIGTAEGRIFMALFEGLISVSPDASRVVPAAAQSWDLSSDGRTYTFHLRAGMKWSNGDPLTSADFLYGFRRVLEPQLGAESVQYAFVIAGARAFVEGKTKDFATVGLRSPDPLTFEITLEHPAPYFLGQLYNYPFFPLHRATLEKHGGYLRRDSKWTRPGNLVSNGPFRLTGWRVNDAVVLEKNPEYWDASRVRLQGVQFHSIDNLDAEERTFRGGRLHATFGLTGQKADAYRAQKSPALHSEPILGTWFITYNVSEPPFRDPRVRRALAFATDRVSLARDVLRGQRPADNLAVRGAGGYVSRSPVPANVAQARALLAAAGFPDGAGFPAVQLTYSASRAGMKESCEALQFAWKRDLGIQVDLAQIEYKVWLDALRTRKHQFILDSWSSRVDDPVEWFGLFTTDSPNNDAGWLNADYDAAFLASESDSNPAARFEHFQKLDALLLQEMPVIPLFHGNKDYLLHPSVRGWEDNALDAHPLQGVWITR